MRAVWTLFTELPKTVVEDCPGGGGEFRVTDVGSVSRAVLSATREETSDARALARRVCQACVANLDVGGAGISLATASSSRETLWASDPTAELLEDLQFSLGEGACVQAARSGLPILVSDLQHSTQANLWPVFAGAAVREAHVGAVFALPLQWGDTNIGVLDLYRRAPGALSDAQLRDASDAAALATTLLLGMLTDPHFGEKLDPLVDGRAAVHVAIGVLMVELASSAVDALARMRAYAFTHGQLLGDVAHEIIDRRLHLPSNPD